MKVYVIGHKSPDTDSVVSAIVISEFLKKKGVDSFPAVAGGINRETEFILSFLKEKKPKAAKLSPKDKLFLVDHNDPNQIVSGGNPENIIGIVDHHRLGGLETSNPIFYRSESLGSTSTVIFKIFKESGIKMTARQAALLVAGIISDTLNFNSATSTEEDKKALKELNKLAKIDIKKFSQEMFNAKSDISGMNMREILTKDFKEFSARGKKLGISVWETVSVGPFEKETERILKILPEIKEKAKLDFFFFFLVDILKIESLLYLVGPEEIVISRKAFNLSGNKKVIKLPGIASRKKQMAPPLLKVIEKQ